MVNTQVRPITIDDYHRMMETGIIREGERVELISGQIFNMAAKGTRHTVATTRLLRELLALIGQQAIVRCQEPIAMPDNSEPEPDIVIARWRDDEYLDSHPAPADIILVIEVADSTLGFDRNTKAPLYATAGVGEYWIVNLVDDRLEIYSQSEGSIYTNTQFVLPSRSIGLSHFVDTNLDISVIFPPRKA
jgi:Uma2 family endonuclease